MLIGRHIRDQWQEVDIRHPGDHHLDPGQLRRGDGGPSVQPPHQEGEDWRDALVQRDPRRHSQLHGRMREWSTQNPSFSFQTQANISNLEAVITGAVGAFLAILGTRGLVWLKVPNMLNNQNVFFRTQVDDPVGASAVHGIAGLWSMVAVGLFAKTDNIEVKIYLSHCNYLVISLNNFTTTVMKYISPFSRATRCITGCSTAVDSTCSVSRSWPVSAASPTLSSPPSSSSSS